MHSAGLFILSALSAALTVTATPLNQGNCASADVRCRWVDACFESCVPATSAEEGECVGSCFVGWKSLTSAVDLDGCVSGDARCRYTDACLEVCVPLEGESQAECYGNCFVNWEKLHQ